MLRLLDGWGWHQREAGSEVWGLGGGLRHRLTCGNKGGCRPGGRRCSSDYRHMKVEMWMGYRGRHLASNNRMLE